MPGGYPVPARRQVVRGEETGFVGDELNKSPLALDCDHRPAVVLLALQEHSAFDQARALYRDVQRLSQVELQVAGGVPETTYLEMVGLTTFTWENNLGWANHVGVGALLATSKSGTLWKPRDQVLDRGLVSSLIALL